MTHILKDYFVYIRIVDICELYHCFSYLNPVEMAAFQS